MIDNALWKMVPTAKDYDLEKIELPEQTSSLDQISRFLPGGSYTTFRTYYGNKVIRFRDHLARLHAAAQLIDRINFEMNTEIIRLALREVLSQYTAYDHRIRVTLDLEQQPGVIYIALEKMIPLSIKSYQQGVKTVTRDIHRETPKAKLTKFIASASKIRSQLSNGVHEALMVSDGKILEGISSNFFAIKDGVVWTAQEGVLLGVTRSVILDIIRSESIPIHLWALSLDNINTIEEAFITSSSRGVLPVVQIDDHVIDAGVPGPMTLQLHQQYLQRIEDELEEI
jgi:branched-chain amino acid aminotransferase